MSFYPTCGIIAFLVSLMTRFLSIGFCRQRTAESPQISGQCGVSWQGQVWTCLIIVMDSGLAVAAAVWQRLDFRVKIGGGVNSYLHTQAFDFIMVAHERRALGSWCLVYRMTVSELSSSHAYHCTWWAPSSEPLASQVCVPHLPPRRVSTS